MPTSSVAKHAGLLEDAIVRAIREAEPRKWLEDNKDAIEYANEHVAKHELFSDDWREL